MHPTSLYARTSRCAGLIERIRKYRASIFPEVLGAVAPLFEYGLERVSDFEHIVIGGGISGLVAAYTLSKKSNAVALIEPEILGGVMRSKQVAGFTLEEGPNVISETPELRTVIEELGLESSVCYPAIAKYRHYVWHDHRITGFPKGPFGLLKTPLLTYREKVRLLRITLSKTVLDPQLNDLSIGEFFERVLGSRGVSNLVDPIFRGIYGGDIFRLSARSLVPKLWAHLRSGKSLLSLRATRNGIKKPRLIVLKGGNSLLASALASHLSIKVCLENERAVSLEPNCHQFVVRCENGRGLRGKHVWLATAGSDSAELCKKIDAPLAEKLNTLSYGSVVVVHLATESLPLPKDCFGVLFPTRESRRVMGMMCNSRIFPHVAPDGCELITLFLDGRSEVSEHIDAEAPEILSRFFAIKDATVLSTRTWKKAIPQLEVGHHKLLEILDAAEKNYENLHFIGSDRGSLGIPGRVGAALRMTQEFAA